MGKVGTGFSTSLDGFIAGPHDGPGNPLGDGGERLFAWSFGGDTDYEMPSDGITLRVSPQSAELLRESHEKAGALVVGRRHFDLAGGWGGRHPVYVPVFVVTHSVPEATWTTFRTRTATCGRSSGTPRGKPGIRDVHPVWAAQKGQCTTAGLGVEGHRYRSSTVGATRKTRTHEGFWDVNVSSAATLVPFKYSEEGDTR